MREQGRITDAELSDGASRAAADHGAARREPLLQRVSMAGGGEYFQEEIRRQLVSMFGAERVLRGGLRVYSTYDPAAACRRAGHPDACRGDREGAAPRQDLQGSLVAIDPATGDVLALVGGRDFGESSFNRATQARRQAGSAFKPIIYAAALERGYAPGIVLRDLDTPIDAPGTDVAAGRRARGESSTRCARR